MSAYGIRAEGTKQKCWKATQVENESVVLVESLEWILIQLIWLLIWLYMILLIERQRGYGYFIDITDYIYP